MLPWGDSPRLVSSYAHTRLMECHPWDSQIPEIHRSHRPNQVDGELPIGLPDRYFRPSGPYTCTRLRERWVSLRLRCPANTLFRFEPKPTKTPSCFGQVSVKFQFVSRNYKIYVSYYEPKQSETKKIKTGQNEEQQGKKYKSEQNNAKQR